MTSMNTLRIQLVLVKNIIFCHSSFFRTFIFLSVLQKNIIQRSMFIIAESAFNHNGDLEYLKKLAHAAKNSGADYFTVQVFKTEDFCVKEYSKYQICKDTELNRNQWKELFDYCREIDIPVIPCVLDESSFEFCYDYGFKFIKIHATDILNLPLLGLIAGKDCRVILETQCATERDIKTALDVLKEKVEVLFHGFSDYPTKYEDQNLRSLDYMREKYAQYKIGFADHTLDIKEIPLMVLAKEIAYLEKHITLDRSNRNYDWQVSLEPNEFKQMVDVLRKYHISLGNNWKHPCLAELKYRDIIYKRYI